MAFAPFGGRSLSRQRIYQDLLRGARLRRQLLRYYSMRRFVPKLEARLALAVRRMECEPDFEAQVDDGTGAPVLGPDGRRRPGIHLEKLGNLCGRRKVCRKAP